MKSAINQEFEDVYKRQLRNIFNEWLVRDTSKKIKAVKRSKGMSGKPVMRKGRIRRSTLSPPLGAVKVPIRPPLTASAEP